MSRLLLVPKPAANLDTAARLTNVWAALLIAGGLLISLGVCVAGVLGIGWLVVWLARQVAGLVTW